MSWMDGIDLITGQSRILTKERTMTQPTWVQRIVDQIKMAEGPLTLTALANLFELQPSQKGLISSAISKGVKEGLIIRVDRGVYALPRKQNLVAKDGWVAPNTTDLYSEVVVEPRRMNTMMEMPEVRVERGGVTCPQALTPGKDFTATIALCVYNPGGDGDNVYFILNGKMWKASQI